MMQSGNLTGLYHFFFMLLRISAIFAISPVFGRKNLPAIAKIGLSLTITTILYPVYPPSGGQTEWQLLDFTLMCMKQIMAGLTMGIVTTCFFSIAGVAGQIIDIQIGFSAASMFDPQYATQVSLTANLYNTVLLICFFLADGHHGLIRLIAESFRLIPVYQVTFHPRLAILFSEIFIKTFVIAVQMAMPIIAATLISEVVMGVLMRMVPQLNFFVIGFPVKVGLGLLVLFVTIPMLVNASNGFFDMMLGAVGKIFEGMVA